MNLPRTVPVPPGMITSGKTETTDNPATPALKVSRCVHPEDLNIGDFVAITENIFECATFFWCGLDSYQHPPDELIRLALRPHDGHQPLIVKSICLPFVLTKTIEGKHVVIDVRQSRLAWLDPTFASAVRKCYKSDLRKEKKKKGKKKRKTKYSN